MRAATFLLTALVATVAVRPAGAAVVACDAVVSDELAAEGELDVHELGFAVADGERLGVQVEVVPLTGTLEPRWRLLDAGGLGAGGCGGQQVGRHDCGPLAAAGNPHRVEVFGTGTGDYRVRVQPLGDAGRCINARIPGLGCDVTLDTGGGQQVYLGTDIGTSIEYRVDSDLIPFAFTALDERVAIDVARVSGEGTFDPRWRLLDRAGLEVAGCDGERAGRHDCGPLPASGNPYAVEIFDGGADGIGLYRAQVQRLTVASSCDGAGDCRIDGSVDSDLFRFMVDTGTMVTIDVERAGQGDASFDPRWRVVDAAGNPVAGCGPNLLGAHQCGPLDVAGNPYQVEVFDQFSDGTGGYAVTVAGAAAACGCGARCLLGVNCGDGTLDPAEQCDAGSLNGVGQFGGSCCTADCRVRPAGFTCGSNTSVCARPAECPGDQGACPANTAEPADKGCVDGNACTTGDHCSGTGQCIGGDEVADTVCQVIRPRTVLAVRAFKRRRGIRLKCAATQVQADTRCAVEGVATAAELATAVGGADVGVPPSCDAFRIAADRDEYRVCRSRRRALNEAGSPVAVKCRPTKCLKAYLSARRAGVLPIQLFAVYEAVGLGSEGDLEGRIPAGVVRLQ